MKIIIINFKKISKLKNKVNQNLINKYLMNTNKKVFLKNIYFQLKNKKKKVVLI